MSERSVLRLLQFWVFVIALLLGGAAGAAAGAASFLASFAAGAGAGAAGAAAGVATASAPHCALRKSFHLVVPSEPSFLAA